MTSAIAATTQSTTRRCSDQRRFTERSKLKQRLDSSDDDHAGSASAGDVHSPPPRRS
jgi:hypothetical protein